MIGPSRMDFKASTLSIEGTLWDALRSLEKSGLEIVLVVEEGGVLAGVLTDGDIRRALLGGVLLEAPLAPHINRAFTCVSPQAGRAEILDLMHARGISQIPILDDRGRLAGLQTLREALGAVTRDNWAVVMAGGQGERLRPLTEITPKPMIKVAGRPILERIVLHLVSAGIRRIFLSVNYKREYIENHFGDGRDFGCRIEYLVEESPLGTGGALSLLPEKPVPPLLVLNGDLLTQFDVESMLSFHAAGGYRLTVGVHEYVQAVPFGVLEMSGDRITGIREKPRMICHVNSGIYVLEPELLDRIPGNTRFPITALIEDCLEREEPVGGISIREEWMDVGHPSDLSRARGKE